MEDIIEGHLQAWEKKNATVIENIVYSDIRLLADVLRVPESRIVSVIEEYITRRNVASTKAAYKEERIWIGSMEEIANANK